MSEQLYIQRHNKVCGVILWQIYKNLNIPILENSCKHEPKVIIKNEEVMLMYNLRIPSSVNTENKALRPDIVLRYKKERMALPIPAIEYQDLSNDSIVFPIADVH